MGWNLYEPSSIKFLTYSAMYSLFYRLRDLCEYFSTVDADQFDLHACYFPSLSSYEHKV